MPCGMPISIGEGSARIISAESKKFKLNFIFNFILSYLCSCSQQSLTIFFTKKKKKNADRRQIELIKLGKANNYTDSVIVIVHGKY